MRFRVVLLFALAALPLFAQHRDEITVQVVDVPVYVRRGLTPVTGLTRENFELLVNGKPQPIDYFDVIDFGEKPPVASPSTPHRMFLFIFDLYFARPAMIGRGQRAAAELVANGGPSDVYAVATFTSGGGIRFLTPLTQDRHRAIRAIASLRATSVDDPSRLTITNDSRAALAPYTGTMFNTGELGDRDALIADLIVDPFTGGGDAMEDNRLRPLQRVAELQVNELRALGKRLASVRGAKHVVFMSEGFNPGLLLDPKHASSYLHESMQRLYRDYHAAGTLLHAMDVAGLRHSTNLLSLPNEMLRIFSRETGGAFLHNTNALGLALAKLAEQHRFEYRLGFQPRAPRRGYNRIVVRLKGIEGNAQVTYRRGFSMEVGR